jgi:integrase
MPLTDKQAKQAKAKDKAYRLSDERGMYLEITTTGRKYWRLKYRYGGKEKRLAIGVYPEITLKKARELRNDARLLLKDGIDPSAQKRIKKITQHDNSTNSFELVALEWLAKEKSQWSESHTKRVTRSLEKDLFPYIGKQPIADITPPELLMALRRVESRGAIETAHRVKQVAGQVFRYGVATGRCERDPSADLKGALANPVTKHLAAITDPKQVGQLLVTIDHFQGTATVKAALLISPMLLSRPGEIRHMEWTEINWDEQQWEIPAAKMKMKAAHIVPLSRQATDILTEQQRLSGSGKYVFPNPRGASRPLSENGVRTALRTLGYDNETMTPHGFRAMGRTLLDEVLGYRIEWIECQLAHAVKDANGRAYNRTTYLKQRSEMMQKWADYLDILKAQLTSSNVVTIIGRRETSL